MDKTYFKQYIEPKVKELEGATAEMINLDQVNLKWQGEETITAYPGKVDKFLQYAGYGWKDITKTIAVGHI